MKVTFPYLDQEILQSRRLSVVPRVGNRNVFERKADQFMDKVLTIKF